MVEHQMDVARLNFSWGKLDEHAEYIRMAREAGKKFGRTIPIIQDLSGPRIQGEEGHKLDPEMKDAIDGVLTQKDIDNLAFGLEQKVEYVALSYVGTADDVKRLKKRISSVGGTAKVMAKIERQKAIDDIENIVRVADAIMIGRGDLGQNIPMEKLPFVEPYIIRIAHKYHKPVITATQMLLSMTENKEPTRAEVTDVAYAIMVGSDAVMLSEESATGKHPIETVAFMEKIVLEAEQHRTTDTIQL